MRIGLKRKARHVNGKQTNEKTVESPYRDRVMALADQQKASFFK